MGSAPALAARLERFCVPAAAVAYGLTAALVVRRPAAPLTMRAADLAAGTGLLVAGALAWWGRRRRLALPVLLAGVVWFAPDWDGWIGAPAAVRSLGAVAAFFLPAALLQLVAVSLHGTPVARGARGGVAVAYAVCAIAAAGHAVVYEPFLDPYCWRNCTDNAFVVHADPGLADALLAVWLGSALAIGVVAAAAATWRLIAASGAARRALAPVLVGAALAGAAEAAYAVARLAMPLEDPRQAGFTAVFYARSVSLVVLAAGIGWSAVRAWRMRATVSRLASELGTAPAPGKLRDALAAATGDPALQVVYWLPDDRRHVGADGHTVDHPGDADGRTATPIVRDGRPIALVIHDAALLDGPGLQREIGSAARLAVDNERLQAEVLAQVADLRASRARIVQAADAERRRLERDLHDGAQQRLLALSYDLRVAHTGARQDGATELARALEHAAEETQRALDELRELAQGIFPAVLAAGGLAPALASLADVAPLAVEVAETITERLPPPVETAAYVAVAEAIADAHTRAAGHVTVATRLDEAGVVVVSVADDGTRRTGAPGTLADRVGALGGALEVESDTLRVEIPCA